LSRAGGRKDRGTYQSVTKAQCKNSRMGKRQKRTLWRLTYAVEKSRGEKKTTLTGARRKGLLVDTRAPLSREAEKTSAGGVVPSWEQIYQPPNCLRQRKGGDIGGS